MTIAPATELDAVFGGVDSHADTIHVAVITDRGGHVADAEFPTTSAGYAAAVAFLNAHRTVTAVVSKGPPPTARDSPVPPAMRAWPWSRSTGPTRPSVAGSASPTPSTPTQPPGPRCPAGHRSYTKDDTVSGIRALHDAARSAVKARTATLNQIAHILITAPDDIRVKYTALRGKLPPPSTTPACVLRSVSAPTPRPCW